MSSEGTMITQSHYFWIIWGVLLMGAYLTHLMRRRKVYKFAAQLKGTDYPVIGDSLLFLGGDPDSILRNILKLSKISHSYTKYFFGSILLVLINKPEDLQVVFNSSACHEKPYFFEFFKVGRGLFSAPTKLWKVHRKMLNPTFNLKILQGFLPIFHQKTLLLADVMSQELDRGQFDVFEFIGRCTLDMVCATTLGTNLDMQKDIKEGDKFIGAMDRFFEAIAMRMFKIYYHIDFIYKNSSAGRQFKNDNNDCFALSGRVLQLKREKEKYGKSAIEDVNSRKPQIYLDQLLRLSKENAEIFDDQAIVDELNTIIIAGYETSALTVSHILLLLAIHQDIQDKVLAEIEEVLYEDSEYPEYELLTKLTYMDMVIKETLRLYPVAPLLTRLTKGDVKLATKDIVVPENVIIIIPLYNIYRDPQYWGANANEFDPEHFSPDNISKRHPYSFLPFGAGPRNCIGNKYAWLSMKIMLINLLRRYRFRTTYTMDTIQVKFSITLRLKHKHLVSIERR